MVNAQESFDYTSEFIANAERYLGVYGIDSVRHLDGILVKLQDAHRTTFAHILKALNQT